MAESDKPVSRYFKDIRVWQMRGTVNGHQITAYGRTEAQALFEFDRMAAVVRNAVDTAPADRQ